MPSIAVGLAGASPASPEHPDRFFKSHKSLPRRTNVIPDDQVIQRPRADHDAQLSNGLPLTTAPILPLTPPGITQDESPTGANAKPTSSHSVATALTPSKPSHPPTPETTPPRGVALSRPGLSQFGYISCSSRAESFQTACEMFSDTETVTSPPSPSRSNTQRSTKSTKSGRGINGLDRSDAVKAQHQSPIHRGSPRSKATNGAGKHRSTNTPNKQRPENDDTPELRIKPIRNKSKRPRNTTESNSTLNASTRERSSLRDRVAHGQQSEDSSAIDQFRQEIGWPSAGGRLPITEPEDSRRHSGVSTSSTIEAVIVDTPKPARRALRHTEKRLSLRSASSPITRSERTSIASSSDLQRRLSHKPARISEGDRRSIASELSVSGSSTLGAPQKSVDVVPVVVIPQRHSSLMGPSNPSSRNPSLSRSRPPSSRAPTIRKSQRGSSDLPRQRKRTMSDSHASKVSDPRGRGMTRPDIPPRSSSLSAPTSQNNSRATSLTSESLRSHNLAVEKVASKRKPEHTKPAPIRVPVLDTPKQDEFNGGILKTQSIVIGVEDLNHLRPPSMPFTPHSIPSSSPGPFEISEVRRVAIFPHNNESLMLVNPYQKSGLQVEQPQTPEIIQQPSVNVDSPLKNPRPPPKPPVSKAVANFVDFDQLHGNMVKKPEPANNSCTRSKRPGLVVRPRSDSFNSFVRTLSLRSAKNPKAGENIDGRAQPFWRPRRFWDESPDSLSPEEDAPQTRAFQQPDEIVSNSAGMPQKRILFDGPSLSASHAGSKRRIEGYHRANRETLVGSRIFTPEALYSQTSLHQRHFSAMSRWRLRLRSGVVRTLRWRFRRSMQRRAEERREIRREKLKKSIGEAVLLDSSTQVRKATL